MCSAAWARRAGRAGRRTGAAAARCRPAAPSCAAAAAAISALASQVCPRAAPPSSFPFHAAPLRGAAWPHAAGAALCGPGTCGWRARSTRTPPRCANHPRRRPRRPAAAQAAAPACAPRPGCLAIGLGPLGPTPGRCQVAEARRCRCGRPLAEQSFAGGAAVCNADVRRAALRALARRCRLGGGTRKNMFMITTPGWSWVSSAPEHACSTACSTQATPSRGRRRRCRAEPPRAARRPGAHWRRPAACRRPRSARA